MKLTLCVVVRCYSGDSRQCGKISGTNFGIHSKLCKKSNLGYSYMQNFWISYPEPFVLVLTHTYWFLLAGSKNGQIKLWKMPQMGAMTTLHTIPIVSWALYIFPQIFILHLITSLLMIHLYPHYRYRDYIEAPFHRKIYGYIKVTKQSFWHAKTECLLLIKMRHLFLYYVISILYMLYLYYICYICIVILLY